VAECGCRNVKIMFQYKCPSSSGLYKFRDFHGGGASYCGLLDYDNIVMHMPIARQRLGKHISYAYVLNSRRTSIDG
jgi:hypothetical protein